MRAIRCTVLGVVVTVLLPCWTPSFAAGQAPHLRIGVEADYVGLFGDWNSGLESGFGGGVTAILSRGLVEGRLGGAVSFHFDAFVDPAISSSGSRPGATYRIERYFGELRLLPFQSSKLAPAIGLRVGLLNRPIGGPPWAWHLEVPASIRLQKGPMPELYVAPGVAIFSKDNWRQSGGASTLRIGSSVSFPVGP